MLLRWTIIRDTRVLVSTSCVPNMDDNDGIENIMEVDQAEISNLISENAAARTTPFIESYKKKAVPMDITPKKR